MIETYFWSTSESFESGSKQAPDVFIWSMDRFLPFSSQFQGFTDVGDGRWWRLLETKSVGDNFVYFAGTNIEKMSSRYSNQNPLVTNIYEAQFKWIKKDLVRGGSRNVLDLRNFRDFWNFFFNFLGFEKKKILKKKKQFQNLFSGWISVFAE